MGLKHFLFSGLIFSGLVILPVHGFAASDLSPRAEVSVKGGSERSTLTTEFWAPLAQKSDRVVYTDLRLMGDDDDNREGNLGIGYRQVYEPTNSVLGIHGWIDRRRTEHNSTFHQVTLGVESLGDKIDLRANGYIPLNGARTVTTPNLGSATPYLAGNGLFYDTTGSINETPQYGLDAEAGYRLPIFEKQADTLRIYGGGYYFFRDNTENILGGRARIEAQINQLVSVGARFQYDAPRGSQGFLEATLRFPFSAKKLYQQDKLRSRLDESPERDIDIVTASKVDNGLHKEILNTSGTQQRILYVDNTQTNGDGTKEHPFNNLTSAQQALQANDILYVFRGDGTTHNMDQGITISQPGVTLVGSGSALTVSGYTFLNAGSAPVLTNTQAFVDDGANSVTSNTGNGVFVTADNINISGINVSGASAGGIYILADNPGTVFHNVTVTNVNTSNNLNGRGVLAFARNGGVIENIVISDIVSENNAGLTGRGAEVRSQDSSYIASALIQNSVTNNNKSIGIFGYFINNSQIGNLSIKNNSTSGNKDSGILIQPTVFSKVENLEVENNNSTGNIGNGVHAFAFNNSQITNVKINGNKTTNSTGSGFGILLQSSNSSIIENTSITDNMSANNNYGIMMTVTGGGVINDLTLGQNIVNNNLMYGIYSFANGGTIGQLKINDTISTSNAGDNIRIESNGATSTIGNVNLTNTTANGSQTARGILVYALTGGTINSATLTNITTNSNKSYGTWIYANSGTINNATLNGITANNNLSNGIVFISATATSVLNNASLSNSNATGNTTNGVYVQKGVASAILNVDLGGGGSSTGQNRIFGNIGNDLNIDRTTVSATNNWWNNGGAAPTRVTLTNGGTATYTPLLATDPRP